MLVLTQRGLALGKNQNILVDVVRLLLDASPQLALLVYLAALRKPSAVFLQCLPVNLLSLVASCTELVCQALQDVVYPLCQTSFHSWEEVIALLGSHCIARVLGPCLRHVPMETFGYSYVQPSSK